MFICNSNCIMSAKVHKNYGICKILESFFVFTVFFMYLCKVIIYNHKNSSVYVWSPDQNNNVNN